MNKVTSLFSTLILLTLSSNLCAMKRMTGRHAILAAKYKWNPQMQHFLRKFSNYFEEGYISNGTKNNTKEEENRNFELNIEDPQELEELLDRLQLDNGSEPDLYNARESRTPIDRSPAGC